MNRTRRVLLVLCASLTVWAVRPHATGPRFLPDDPLSVDPEHEDASGAKPHYSTQASDALDTLKRRGAGGGQRAVNVNTLDEVPDSSWYTNRFGTRALSIEAMVRGPLVHAAPTEGAWTITSAESDQPRPRLTARDVTGAAYVIRFDSRSNPEMATGAEAIATRLLHALGYNTAENYLIEIRREDLAIGRDAAVHDGSGRRRLMTRIDLDILLAKAAPGRDGRYRAIASRSPEGTALGPFRFAGVRGDDPNDVFLHEHRRELRGLGVFLAWLEHVDTQPIETRDVLVGEAGRRVVRHYLIDFASTLGSGAALQTATRAANEYSWASRPKLKTALTLGFYPRPWIKAPPTGMTSVGPYEGSFFDPEKWTTPYPTAAFLNARADDRFWAARRVMAITDEAIAAAVGAARYSDPRAELHLTEALITRRDKIGRAWLNAVLPLVDCKLAAAGTLTCSNAAVDAHLAAPATEYRIKWYRFNNDLDTREAVGAESIVPFPVFAAPHELLETSEFVVAEICGHHEQYTGWATPMTVYFRKSTDGWRAVGITRF